MASKLSVIFFIILCLEVGIALIILPWYNPFGMSDWGDNYLLLYAARKTGFMSLQHMMASGWVRGAVSGLGALNIVMAFWEIAHFNQTVRYLQGETNRPDARKDAPQSARDTDQLPHHQRHDSGERNPGQ